MQEPSTGNQNTHTHTHTHTQSSVSTQTTSANPSPFPHLQHGDGLAVALCLGARILQIAPCLVEVGQEHEAAALAVLQAGLHLRQLVAHVLRCKGKEGGGVNGVS